jgi:hypothetical protein
MTGPHFAAGGTGADRRYVVHYRRTDGTEAAETMTADGCRTTWTAPEDCAAVTGIEITGGGGSSTLPVPGDVFAGMKVSVHRPGDTAGPG